MNDGSVIRGFLVVQCDEAIRFGDHVYLGVGRMPYLGEDGLLRLLREDELSTTVDDEWLSRTYADALRLLSGMQRLNAYDPTPSGEDFPVSLEVVFVSEDPDDPGPPLLSSDVSAEFLGFDVTHPGAPFDSLLHPKSYHYDSDFVATVLPEDMSGHGLLTLAAARRLSEEANRQSDSDDPLIPWAVWLCRRASPGPRDHGNPPQGSTNG